MAKRNILKDTEPLLRKKSRTVEQIDERVITLLDDMKETLEKSGGVGLASVQVGVLKRAFVINVNNCYLEVINPRIVKTSGSQTGPEGCLSIPGKQSKVCRPNKITVEFVDRYNFPMSITTTDFMARAFCHEYDHLDGILYIDHTK